jgi:cytosine/adenosine deaminase-related metal-dependent hydrolase
MSGAGLVNAQTHLYSGPAPFGMPVPAETPQNFVQILERVWWKLDRALDARSLGVSAQWHVAEALQLGTVGLVDHESPNFIEGSLGILADACQSAGIPAVLCYGATERNGGRDEARRGLAECRRFIATNARPALLEDAPRHGDNPDAAAQRPQAGHALLAELLGGVAPAPRATTSINLDAIRAEATSEALRLWSRMADL